MTPPSEIMKGHTLAEAAAKYAPRLDISEADALKKIQYLIRYERFRPEHYELGRYILTDEEMAKLWGALKSIRKRKKPGEWNSPKSGGPPETRPKKPSSGGSGGGRKPRS